MCEMSGDNTLSLSAIPLSHRCHTDAWRVMMSEHGGKTYRPWQPEHYRQEAHSPEAKLPEGDLVFFLLDTVPQME